MCPWAARFVRADLPPRTYMLYSSEAPRATIVALPGGNFEQR
jgi:hypothetical protein